MLSNQLEHGEKKNSLLCFWCINNTLWTYNTPPGQFLSVCKPNQTKTNNWLSLSFTKKEFKKWIPVRETLQMRAAFLRRFRSSLDLKAIQTMCLSSNQKCGTDMDETFHANEFLQCKQSLEQVMTGNIQLFAVTLYRNTSILLLHIYVLNSRIQERIWVWNSSVGIWLWGVS